MRVSGTLCAEGSIAHEAFAGSSVKNRTAFSKWVVRPLTQACSLTCLVYAVCLLMSHGQDAVCEAGLGTLWHRSFTLPMHPAYGAWRLALKISSAWCRGRIPELKRMFLAASSGSGSYTSIRAPEKTGSFWENPQV